MPDRPADEPASDDAARRAARPWPHGALIRDPRLLGLGLMTFCAAWAEGAANDWLALMLTDDRGASEALAALGFAVFAGAMTLGRAVGNQVVGWLGRVRSLRTGAVLAAIGVTGLLAIESLPVAYAGAAALGAGHLDRLPAGDERRGGDAGARRVGHRDRRDDRLRRLPRRAAAARQRSPTPPASTPPSGWSSCSPPASSSWPATPGRLGAACAAQPCEADRVPEDLDAALAGLRPLLLDGTALVRAVAAGRRRGASPPWRRVELRPIDLKAGRHLQVVTYDERAATTTNHAVRRAGRSRRSTPCSPTPFGNWHVQTTDRDRCSCGSPRRAPRRSTAQPAAAEQQTGHDRGPQAPDRPGRPAVLRARRGGGQAPAGRRVPACAGELRSADVELPADRPLRVVDLGCGNAYLSFAAYRFLGRASRDVELTGVDLRAQSRERNTALAAELGWSDRCALRRGRHHRRAGASRRSTSCSPCTPATPRPTTRWRRPCAGARRWCSPRRAATTTCSGRWPRPGRRRRTPCVTRHGILRERLGDVLTDAFRAALLRTQGYRVDVLQFVVGRVHPAQHDAARGPAEAATPRPRAERVRRDGRRVGRHAAPADPARCRRLAPLVAAALSGLLATGSAGGAELVLRLHDPALVESSGLAVSGRHDGVLWTTPGRRRRSRR